MRSENIYFGRLKIKFAAQNEIQVAELYMYYIIFFLNLPIKEGECKTSCNRSFGTRKHKLFLISPRCIRVIRSSRSSHSMRNKFACAVWDTYLRLMKMRLLKCKQVFKVLEFSLLATLGKCKDWLLPNIPKLHSCCIFCRQASICYVHVTPYVI